ncbi:MAG: hexokinase [Treponema sp.]|nr:hexokinase [Treponema sp.]
MNKAIAAFLGRHNFSVHQNINPVVDALLHDMREGLSGRPASQDMIRTYCTPPSETATGKSVIVIDAGGTNFRSCLVTFDSIGKPSIDFMEKTNMPGVERELSRAEFFEHLAKNLEHVKDKADRIGFCFSYPMTITEDGDGILLGFSKEVKAPEVVGCHIGAELAKALSAHGWKNKMRISLLNDTLAALLAGAAGTNSGKRYSSYIGFILGTGMNGAYIQSATPEYKIAKEQVIVCESGKFDKIGRSDFDDAFDAHSISPGTSRIEKMCSGAYLGPVGLYVIRAAAKEGLLSAPFAASLLQIEQLSLVELDTFLHSPYGTSSVLGKKAAETATGQDYDMLFQLLDAVVDRSARYAAAILSACVIQSGKGGTASRPVCILCNGTTFHKTYKLQVRVEGYLEQLLTRERNLHYEIIRCENDITLGTAIAGLL